MGRLNIIEIMGHTNTNFFYKKKIVVVVEKPFFVDKTKNWLKCITKKGLENKIKMS
ncbi:unnamed protein product [marine sediment metagenome]|uniref:Uncharacterized protein n=1 Tax=marine sediment metagenome TaxID=412755 RepID=X1Q1A1_9ZZZZ